MKATWKVSCGACGHGWHQDGHWSAFEQQSVESRPCPKCGAYTLQSPEPSAKSDAGRGPSMRMLNETFRRMVWAVG